MERKDAVTMKGMPMSLLGPELRPGLNAPEFKVVDSDMKEVRLSDTKGKVRLIAAVPSLDTPVCHMEAVRFNQEAEKLPADKVAVLVVSMDLPFASKRFCGAEGVRNLKALSDHREASFGAAYGVLIKDLRLLSRAIFVIDGNDMLRYVEYVREVGDHPDYEAALNAVREVAGITARAAA